MRWRSPSSSAFVFSVGVFLSCFLGSGMCIESVCQAEIQPNEVGIIVANRAESSEVGEYYAQKRNIPGENILSLELPATEEMSRAEWEKTVRPAIRKWLGENKRATQLRCLVTTYGVPLRIGKSEDDRQSKFRRYFLERERAQAARRLTNIVTTLNKLGVDPAVAPAADSALDEKTDAQTFQAKLQESLEGAQSRLQQLADLAQRQQATQQFQQLMLQGGGFTTLVNVLGQGINRAPAEQQQNMRLQLAQTQGHLTGLAEARNAMEGLPANVQRDGAILGSLNAIAGRLGQLGWIDAQLELFEKNESESSFDSELALILWPEYDLLRWQPNFLHYRYDGSELRTVLRTMMVGRLDGPNPAIAKQLVDLALQAESKGVTGNIYLDSRGLSKLDGPSPSGGSPEDYDLSLLKCDQILQKQNALPVKLESSSELLKDGGAADAAFYCGWYSLANYVDAFTWTPGAVGYHLANSEAVTLRDPDSNVWCKRMLEDGITATIGPVAEPYFSAFPRPDEFFPLLLSGKLTLAECYYRTQPLNSWMMVLIGDPLYRPFARQPALPAEHLSPVLLGAN